MNCSLDTAIDSQDATSYMFKQCADGYHGPLCSQCTKEGPERYGRTGTWSCQKCKSTFAILVTFVASNLVVLAFLYYSIHTTLQDNEEELANYGQKAKPSELTRVSLRACCAMLCCICGIFVFAVLCCRVLALHLAFTYT